MVGKLEGVLLGIMPLFFSGIKSSLSQTRGRRNDITRVVFTFFFIKYLGRSRRFEMVIEKARELF
jgi:hypothetical protein